MYDIKWIRENPEAFDKGLKRRGLEPLSGKLLALDEKRRAAITQFEQAQARRNAASKEIGEAKKKKDEAAAQKLMAEVNELKVTLPALEAEQKKFGDELDKELAQIPNLPADDVPDGADEKGNVERHQHGAKRNYAFKPKQHFELGEVLGMMDFELAAKLSGARFVVLQKGLARMERALGQLFLDVHTSEKHGYTEVSPPLLVRDEVDVRDRAVAKVCGGSVFHVQSCVYQNVRKICHCNHSEKARSISDRCGQMSGSRNEKSRNRFENLHLVKISGSSPPPKCRSPIWCAS